MADCNCNEPFRLLDLPQELQDRIYEKYFEGEHPMLNVNFNWAHGEARVSLISDVKLEIELVSKKLYQDVRRTRSKHLKATLRVCTRMMHVDAYFTMDLALAAAESESKYSGLCQQIATFELRGIYDQKELSLSSGDNAVTFFNRWKDLLSCYPNLRQINVKLTHNYGLYDEDQVVDPKIVEEYESGQITSQTLKAVNKWLELTALDSILKAKFDTHYVVACSIESRYYNWSFRPKYLSPYLFLDLKVKNESLWVKKKKFVACMDFRDRIVDHGRGTGAVVNQISSKQHFYD